MSTIDVHAIKGDKRTQITVMLSLLVLIFESKQM